MKAFSRTLQVIVSILLSFVILVQQKGSGMGSAIGGSAGGEFFATKRGAEKVLAIITVVLATIFCVNALIFPLLPDSES